MTPRLYVYYKVDAAHLATTVAAARAMQAQLAARHAGLVCHLLRRPEPSQGLVTLMETYGGQVPADFAQVLEAAALNLPRPRHAEWFELIA